jgi:hypothetical protein
MDGGLPNPREALNGRLRMPRKNRKLAAMEPQCRDGPMRLSPCRA